MCRAEGFGRWVSSQHSDDVVGRLIANGCRNDSGKTRKSQSDEDRKQIHPCGEDDSREESRNR